MAVKKNSKESAVKETDYSRYYSAGSAAPQILPLEEPEVYTEKTKKKHKKYKSRRKSSEQIFTSVLYHSKLAFAIFTICICGIVTTGLNSVVLEKERAIKSLKNDLNEMKEANLLLETDIAEQVDLKYIEQEAIERLGMKKPENYQIVYIDVPSMSYTVQNKNIEAEEENKHSGIVEYIYNAFLKIFG